MILGIFTKLRSAKGNNRQVNTVNSTDVHRNRALEMNIEKHYQRQLMKALMRIVVKVFA